MTESNPLNIQETNVKSAAGPTPTEQAIKKYCGRKWARLRLVGEGDSRHLEFTNRFGKIWDVVFSRDKEKRAKEYNLSEIIRFINKAEVAPEGKKEKEEALAILRQKAERQMAKQRSATVEAREQKLLDALDIAPSITGHEILPELLEKIRTYKGPHSFESRGKKYNIKSEAVKQNEAVNQMIRVTEDPPKGTILVKLSQEPFVPSGAAAQEATTRTTTKISVVYQDEGGRTFIIRNVQDMRYRLFVLGLYEFDKQPPPPPQKSQGT